MDLRLRDRTVLVTGGTRGLGLAIARVLHQEGARVVIFSSDPRELVAAAKAVGEIVAVPADIRRRQDVALVLRTAGPLDAIVHRIDEPDSGDTRGALEFLRAACRGLRRGAGRIVNVVGRGRAAAAQAAERVLRGLERNGVSASFVVLGGSAGAGVKDEDVAHLVAILVSSRASWEALCGRTGRAGPRGRNR